MTYHNYKIQIKENDPLFGWCDEVTKACNNLYNAALFIERQLRTGLKKEPEERFENEKNLIEQVETALIGMNATCVKSYEKRLARYRSSNDPKKEEPVLKVFSMPTAERPLVWYEFLDAYLKELKDVDYFYKSLPRQTAQQILKNVCQNIKAYFAALKSYNEDKTNFTGEPKFPKYHRKGGNTAAVVTNQDCRITQDKNGVYWAKLPKTKNKCRLGKSIMGKLKEVHICPFHGIFELNFVFEVDVEVPAITEVSSRICAIDFGVNNLAAIANNIGEPFLLFKGGVIKSVNQWYNKKMAAIMSEQTKGTANKFVPTPESRKICLRRDIEIDDFMHKTAKRIIDWCVKNNIDTIVMGINKGWKQKCNLGKANTQNFVEIPFHKLQSMICYLAGWNGILVVEQEESYTSKASFLDSDPIPVYKKGDKTKHRFSGYREKRGVYKRKQGKKEEIRINADLNGAANIGRKAFPALFTPETCSQFRNVIVFKHPDQEKILENKKKQLQKFGKSSTKKQKKRIRKNKKSVAELNAAAA